MAKAALKTQMGKIDLAGSLYPRLMEVKKDSKVVKITNMGSDK